MSDAGIDSGNDWYRRDGDDLLLWIKAQPKSSKDGFAEVLGDAIKLRITAPPIEGRANKHIVNWLARQFGVARSAVMKLIALPEPLASPVSSATGTMAFRERPGSFAWATR